MEKRDYGKFIKWLKEKDTIKFTGKEVQVPGKRIRVDVCGIGIDEEGNLFSYAIEVKQGKIRIDHVAKALTYRSFFTDCYLAVGKKYDFPKAIYEEAKRQGIGLVRYLRGVGVEVVLEAIHCEANDERAMAAKSIADEVTICKKCRRFFWYDENEEDENIDLFIWRPMAEDEITLCKKCKYELLVWLNQK